MHIRILCIGRMKDCPEREMVNDYIKRAQKTGRGLGIRSVEEIEVEAGGGKSKESERLIAKAGKARLIRLDERGKALKSLEFSKKIANWRDSGEDIAFLIGGADGHAPELADKAREAISFGVQTWPHKLVRVMIAEQIYRALSIEAGSPYHRE
ncbi:23S rRNA (pseudouridine(1915)-N(3))-methyltransferase RlmH [Hirschia maritima]|uniref:23S rRNA (pseudouridine(1915)-N(3))-methyltransferase RlmH n=1 Tax=Hirschia maritima TaxID=1121961 RepID=UPI000364ECCF|nr:23S rRNA (pseudouridine(1915)-N(3))-methyltransferase RlmH [Hirschia maritima]